MSNFYDRSVARSFLPRVTLYGTNQRVVSQHSACQRAEDALIRTGLRSSICVGLSLAGAYAWSRVRDMETFDPEQIAMESAIGAGAVMTVVAAIEEVFCSDSQTSRVMNTLFRPLLSAAAATVTGILINGLWSDGAVDADTFDLDDNPAIIGSLMADGAWMVAEVGVVALCYIQGALAA